MRKITPIEEDDVSDENKPVVWEPDSTAGGQASQFNPFKPEAVFKPSKALTGETVVIPAVITDKVSPHLYYLVSNGSEAEVANIVDQICTLGCADIAFQLNGARLLRKIVEVSPFPVVAKIIAHIQDDAVAMAQDDKARLVLITLFRNHHSVQVDKLVQNMVEESFDVISDCCDPSYSLVMSAIIQHGSPQSRRLLGERIVGHMVELSTDDHGNFPAQQALESLDADLVATLTDELIGHADTFIEVATSQSGCFVLQQLLEHLDAAGRAKALDAMRPNIGALAISENGHFCVQTVLRCFPPAERDVLVNELLSSREQILECCMSEHGKFVIRTLMNTPAGSPAQRQLIRDAQKPQIMIVNPSPPKPVKLRTSRRFRRRAPRSRESDNSGVLGFFKNMWSKLVGK
jgi:hypothetical protein